jgi:hypothetical protein
MKTYEAVFNSNTTDGVYGISLVEDPAMEGHFIALSKQSKIKLAEVDKEQRILMGLVLEPNKLVYRNQGGEEFNMVFSANTIKELSHNFFKQGFQRNSTIEHDQEQKINDVTFVESWIVEDPKNDKSNAFGFSYPKGSWIASMKVDDDKIWDEYIKSGKVQGFSIDAMINLKEVKLKSNIKMAEEQKTFKEQVNEVLVSLGLIKGSEQIKLGMVKTMDGNVVIYYDGEELMKGAAVWAQSEDGERLPLPAADYDTEMGLVVVGEDGTVSEIKPKQEEMAEETKPEQTAAPSTDEITNAIKSLLIKYSEESEKKLEEVKAEFSKTSKELKKENEELKKEVLELSKQEVGRRKAPPTQVDLSKMSELEKRRYWRANEN